MRMTDIKDKFMYECPSCILFNFDPLHRVLAKNVLIKPFYLKTPQTVTKNFFLDNEICDMMASNRNIGVEVRCIMVDGLEHEQTWPDDGTLHINN